MNCRSCLLLVLSAYLTATSPSVAQQDSSEQALEEIGEWLNLNLPKFGNFSLELIKDIARADSRNEEGIKLRARYAYSDVSLQDCTLRFVENVTSRLISGQRELRMGFARPLDPGQGPQPWTLMLRLGAVDISSVRARAYELPFGWRVELSQRSEVHLKARPGAYGDQAFIEISPEGAEQYAFEQSIPVNKPGSARILAEKLRHAAKLCGAT